MANREVLKKAFVEACDMNMTAISAGGEVEFDVLETAMKTIVKRDGISATPEEITEIVIEGIKQLKEVGKDFSYQNWAMPR